MTQSQIAALDALIEAVERGEFKRPDGGFLRFYEFDRRMRLLSIPEDRRWDAIKALVEEGYTSTRFLSAYRAQIGGDA